MSCPRKYFALAAAWPGRSSSSVTLTAAMPGRARERVAAEGRRVDERDSLSSTFQILGVEMKAESGMTPPPSALPRHMMSGTVSQWSTPNILPVRPSPVWTSSAISRAPYSSHALRMRGQKSSGGTIAPASP